MRNKVKYASIIAVALLTAAPMINPIVVKASPNIEAGNVKNSEKSEKTTYDFQYSAEITVEEGSLISDIKDKYTDVALIDSVTKENVGNILKVSPVNSMLFLEPEYGVPFNTIHVFAGDKFSSKDRSTYYRNVSVTFDSSEYLSNKELLTANGSSDISGLRINVADNIISYFQKITIISPISPEQPKDISGVAIVNHENNFYHLYNTNNELIDHRALVANSHWQVDKVRTINGEKQYRVSTNEWIKASDVTFIANAEVNYSMTITPLTQAQQITLDGDGHYRLHNSDMEVSDHRALSGGTSWLVDKIGRDAHGGVYYGVSTNEFVKAGDGVNLVK